MKKTSRMGALLIALSLLIAGCMGGGGALQEYSISGIITDASGNGVAGVTVVLSGGSSKTATTRADGTWDADGLKGRVTVTPQKDGWYFDPPSRTVDRANDEVDFQGQRKSSPVVR
ncbi:MAG: carboxypeptidase-like regulatory domain-containing protein [Limnochordia bacterium]